MKLVKKTLFIMMAMLLLVPVTAFGQEFPEIDGEKELSESIKGMSPKLQESEKIRHSKQGTTSQSTNTTQSTNPKSYPLKKNGEWIDTLLDSWDTEHDFFLDGVENYTSKEMNVRVLYASEHPYLKDGIVTLEFYKESKGKLTISGGTQFNTYGYSDAALNTFVPKSMFAHQPYLYIRMGISEYTYDDYYEDVTMFKVKNPYYVDKTPPAVPTVSAVSNRDKKVTGKAEAGSTVTVKAGTKVLASAKADKAGKFTVPLKTAQKAGTALYVTAKDKAGNVSKARKVIVKDKIPPAAPKVSKVTIKSTAVKGKTEAYATVSVKVGKKVIGTAKAGKTGSFSVKIKKQKAGTALYVYAKDKAGNTSKSTKTTVQKK